MVLVYVRLVYGTPPVHKLPLKAAFRPRCVHCLIKSLSTFMLRYPLIGMHRLRHAVIAMILLSRQKYGGLNVDKPSV